MWFSEGDEVRVHHLGIGTIEKVIYIMENGRETDDIYCYGINIDGSTYTVYPDEIDE